MIDVVLFRSGDHRLALEADEVLGASGPAGGLPPSGYPAVESLFGLPEPERRARPLLITLTGPQRAFVVDGPLELRSLAPETIHCPPPILLRSSALRGLRALAFDEAGLVLVFGARARQPCGASARAR